MTDDLTLNMDAYLPLRDVVFNTLREAILKGDLKPGERLMELQLAAKLGVSRTPIHPYARAGGTCCNHATQRGRGCKDDAQRYGRRSGNPGGTG